MVPAEGPGYLDPLLGKGPDSPDLGSVNSTSINLGDDLTPQTSVSSSGKWAECGPLHAVKLQWFDEATCKKPRMESIGGRPLGV